MDENVLKIKEILLYYSLKYKGDWKNIYNAISTKEEIDNEEMKLEINKCECNYVTILDESYPEKLKNCNRPPFVLFYYGDLSLLKSKKILGVVGSRDCTEYGKKVTEDIIDSIENEEVVILSGLAKGIDAAAHKSALKRNLNTVAILGVGIEKAYPKENFKLYGEIKDKGLLISEYPYKEIVSHNNFLLRNRLVAALSDYLFVPDVKERSGTMVTIKMALELGKEILVAPTSIYENLINNMLILEGATPIISSKDINEIIK